MNAQVNSIIIELLKPYNPKQICVFGSYARDEMQEDSDIDILVDFDTPVNMFDLGGLYMRLAERLKRKVDLVRKQNIHPLIRPYIEQDLIEIYRG